MKIACISFTEDGKIIGNKLENSRNRFILKNPTIIDHYENSKISGGIKGHIERIFQEYDGIIFISALGIAVRMISPYIDNKFKDPAVVVMDDLGRYSISLLSGHIGGANELAKRAADIIGSIPIITTASDGRDIEALDSFARTNGYEIEDTEAIKNIMALMVNNKRIGFYSEDDKVIGYGNLKILEDFNDIQGLSGIIAITSREDIEINLPHAILRFRNINIGIGCRKNTSSEEIINFIKEELKKRNLSIKGIRALGTIEAKKKEKGIIEAAKYFDCSLEIFSLEDIREVEDKFKKSEFVKKTLGVYSVAEPCAYLLQGRKGSPREKKNGITLSVEVQNE